MQSQIWSHQARSLLSKEAAVTLVVEASCAGCLNTKSKQVLERVTGSTHDMCRGLDAFYVQEMKVRAFGLDKGQKLPQATRVHLVLPALPADVQTISANTFVEVSQPFSLPVLTFLQL